jgi:hypothetical protein
MLVIQEHTAALFRVYISVKDGEIMLSEALISSNKSTRRYLPEDYNIDIFTTVRSSNLTFLTQSFYTNSNIAPLTNLYPIFMYPYPKILCLFNEGFLTLCYTGWFRTLNSIIEGVVEIIWSIKCNCFHVWHRLRVTTFSRWCIYYYFDCRFLQNLNNRT